MPISSDPDQWSKVDVYFTALFAPPDAHLEGARAANAKAGLPAHDVSAMQGKMLALFIAMTRSCRVLEIGTLGGYSTIWMARSLPKDGQITSIERDEVHARLARDNIARAGLSGRVDLRVGAALEVLPTLKGPFDLIFIDADKSNNPHYLEWAIRLSRPGTVIIADNVVRGGAIMLADSHDADAQGIRDFLHMLSDDCRLDATAIQTVGEKGWDGFALAIVK